MTAILRQREIIDRRALAEALREAVGDAPAEFDRAVLLPSLKAALLNFERHQTGTGEPPLLGYDWRTGTKTLRKTVLGPHLADEFFVSRLGDADRLADSGDFLIVLDRPKRLDQE